MTSLLVDIVLVLTASIAAIMAAIFVRQLFAFGMGHPEWILPAVFWIIIFSKVFSIGLSGRDLSHLNVPDYLNFSPAADPDSVGGGVVYDNVLRLCTFLLLALPVIQIVYSRFICPLESWGSLFWGVVVFFIGNFVLNAIFGTHPAFAVSNLYFAIGVAGVLNTRPGDIPAAMYHVKLSAIVLVVLSLIALLIFPSLVAETGYRGVIPGLDIRLHGFTSNPNAMGPMCLVPILLEISFPQKSRLASWSIILIAGFALLLSQSKTTWIAGVLAIGISYVAIRLPGILADIHSGVVRSSVALAFAGILGLVALLGILAAFGDSFSVFGQLSSRENAELTSLTGRDAIWKVAMAQWEKNPLFGYGPELWNADFRTQVGMSFAFSAHNEYIQSLSRAGSVGLVALLIYMGVIAWYAIAKTRDTNGLSLMLFVVLVVRSISETPLSNTTFATSEAFTHLLLLAVLRWPRTEQSLSTSPLGARVASTHHGVPVA